MRVHGVDVDESLLWRWRGWIAPATQPFFLSEEDAKRCQIEESAFGARKMSDELHDSYALWRVPRELRVLWLDEERFRDAPRATRTALVRAQIEHGRHLVPSVRRWAGSFSAAELRAQADGHRFVWWPSMLEHVDDETLAAIVTDIEVLNPSRHREVAPEVWRDAATVLPGAAEVAGSFADGSGPNCFGTVMAAAGVREGAAAWTPQDEFEAWLRENTREATGTGHDAHAGTVLVWRDQDGDAAHTAVTLGAGWGLHKPSQCWHTPRKVLTVGEILRVSRAPGLRLRRYRVNLPQ